MIRALRQRTRPDNMVNQVRSGGKSFGRRIYLGLVCALGAFLAIKIMGPFVFLSADGLVTKDRMVSSTDYLARVAEVRVRPGDAVRAGTVLARLESSQTIDAIADLTGKTLALETRLIQIESRLGSITRLLPVAEERRVRVGANFEQAQGLLKRRLITAHHYSELTRQLYEAERETEALRAEEKSLGAEIEATRNNLRALKALVLQMKEAYNDGLLVAKMDGIVGTRLASAGAVIKPGEPVLELYKGQPFVLGYVSSDRFFSLDIGERVIITDGAQERKGRITRIDAVADQLPPEFQSTHRSVDRKQVVRVEFEDANVLFPVNAKVTVTRRFTPAGLYGAVTSTVLAASDGLAVVKRWLFGGTTAQAAP